MSMDLVELQKIFEYELKRKLAQKCRTKNDELRLLLNSFKFYDYESSLIIDKNKWIKGVLKTGLCGFNIYDLSDIFNKYDINNTGFINYKNFSYYLYGKEELLPLTKNNIDNNVELINYQKNNRLKSPFNDFKPPGLYERNFQMLELENKLNSRTPNINQYQEISKNNNNNNYYNNIKNKEYNDLIQKQAPNTPFPHTSNLKTNINSNLNNNNNEYKNNLSIQNYSFSFEKDSYFQKLLLLLRSKINTDNGVTYYTFAQKLKSYENNNKTISLNSFYSSLRDVNISFRLNDLTDLFNYIDKSKINLVPTENILQLIRGNLNKNRKKLIEYSYSLIDKDKNGRIPISLVKGLYNCKLHPDVYVGFKQEEDIYKEFCYTFDLYCNLYNINEYITCEEFVEYYWGVSASRIDDNYFEDILNGVWNQNNKTNKNINMMINENLNINKKSHENYRRELIDNKINNNSNYFLNNRYVNNNNGNKFINYRNNSNSNIIKSENHQNNNNYNLLSYTPNPRENELNNENVSPYYHPQKTPLYKGVKMYRYLRHNPITNEFIMSKETPIDGYYESLSNKNINYNKNNNYNYDNTKNNSNNINNNINYDKPIKELDEFKKILISRGQKGIFNFQKLLCLYDKDKKGEISRNKFNELLEIFNINMNKHSINLIFEYFDKDKKGIIKYDDLIKELIGNINKNRELLIKNVYDTFKDKNNNNIYINVLKDKFKAFNHPYVKNQIKSEQEVYYDFLESIDVFRNYKNNINGLINNNEVFNYEEFLDFFKEISMNIKDDKFFEDFLINCWNINKENNVYNIHRNNEINSLKDNNLIIRTANQILNNNGYNN